jgi:hypothetical protein
MRTSQLVSDVRLGEEGGLMQVRKRKLVGIRYQTRHTEIETMKLTAREQAAGSLSLFFRRARR